MRWTWYVLTALVLAAALLPGCADPCRTHGPDYYHAHDHPK